MSSFINNCQNVCKTDIGKQRNSYLTNLVHATYSLKTLNITGALSYLATVIIALGNIYRLRKNGESKYYSDKVKEEVYAYDLDGTLIDAEDYDRWWIVQNVSMVSREYWKDRYCGKGWEDILEELLKDEIKDKEALDSRIWYLNNCYNKEFLDMIKGKDKDNSININRKLIQQIRKNGKNNIVITSRDPEQAEAIVEYLGIKDNIIEIYSGGNDIKKFNNIDKAREKYNIIKAYDDKMNIVNRYKEVSIRAVYVEHDYNAKAGENVEHIEFY